MENTLHAIYVQHGMLLSVLIVLICPNSANMSYVLIVLICPMS